MGILLTCYEFCTFAHRYVCEVLVFVVNNMRDRKSPDDVFFTINC